MKKETFTFCLRKTLASSAEKNEEGIVIHWIESFKYEEGIAIHLQWYINLKEGTVTRIWHSSFTVHVY